MLCNASTANNLAVVTDRIAMIRPIEASGTQRRRALDVPCELAAFKELLEPLAMLMESVGDTGEPKNSISPPK